MLADHGRLSRLTISTLDSAEFKDAAAAAAQSALGDDGGYKNTSQAAAQPSGSAQVSRLLVSGKVGLVVSPSHSASQLKGMV